MTGHLLMDYKKSISFCPDLFILVYFIFEKEREKKNTNQVAQKSEEDLRGIGKENNVIKMNCKVKINLFDFIYLKMCLPT